MTSFFIIMFRICLLLLCVIKVDLIAQPFIKVDPTNSRTGKLALSDLVESIEYIPLETNRDCLVGEIEGKRYFEISQNYILIHYRKSYSFFLFDRKGKFIAKIGSVGSGPGEYLQHLERIYGIDEVKQRVIISTSYPSRLMYFDLKGKFIESKEIDKNFTEATYMVLSKDNVLIVHPGMSSLKLYPFTYDIYRDNKLVAQRIKTIPYTMAHSNTVVRIGFCHYWYDNKLHVKEALRNDTIYIVDFKDNSFKPKYLLNFGKYSHTTEILRDVYHYGEVMKDYARLEELYEIKNNILISYLFQDKHLYQYFDKSNNLLFRFNSVTGIPNDFDGGLDFWPQYQNNNELVAFYDAYLFEENLSRQKQAPKGPKPAVESMKKLYRKIDPEDNPVMVVVKLKQ